jgi:hypothetical protein
MDPQAAWDQLQEALRDGDWEAVRELAESLLDWLNRGGFAPVIAQTESHDAAQQRAAVLRFCLAAIQQADTASAG